MQGTDGGSKVFRPVRSVETANVVSIFIIGEEDGRRLWS